MSNVTRITPAVFVGQIYGDSNHSYAVNSKRRIKVLSSNLFTGEVQAAITQDKNGKRLRNPVVKTYSANSFTGRSRGFKLLKSNTKSS